MVLGALSKCLFNTDRLGGSTTTLGSLVKKQQAFLFYHHQKMTGQVLLSLIVLLWIFLWQAGFILNFQVVKLPTSKLSAWIHFCTSFPLALALLIPLGSTGYPTPPLIFPECLLPQQWDHGWDGTGQQSASHVTHSQISEIFLQVTQNTPDVLWRKRKRI